MAVRGTTNYVYFSDQSLGNGSSGTVYYGRHKRKGTPCAVKTFKNDAPGTKERQTREREFDVMQRLKHENIVQFIAIEPESRNNERVLIMELCQGGSLYKILEEPENAFGFEEDEFLIFLRDITRALEYLHSQKIVHRDIKPGNILRHIKDDSTSVYKLTDFGASRRLHNGDEEFMSLYGTEEYLHPAVFERALLPGSTGPLYPFNASIDLWSLAVTIFHVATGHLPFQSYGGRKNKEDMYRIISQKKPGFISGVQEKKHGDIVWRRDLPATCHLSQGLKKLLLPMLVQLLEANTQSQGSFENFFQLSNHVMSCRVVHIFSPSTCREDRLYAGRAERQSESHLKDAVAELTGLHHSKQQYHHKYLQLSDMLLDPKATATSSLMTTVEFPFYVIPFMTSVTDSWSKTSNVIPPEYPDMTPSSSSLADDAALARAACAAVIYLSRKSEELTRQQMHIMNCVQIIHQVLVCTSREISASAHALLSASEDLSLYDVINSPRTDAERRLVDSLQAMKARLAEIVSPSLDTWPLRTFQSCINSRQQSLCHATMKKFVKELKHIYASFKQQRNKTLSYNDEQIHKFDKMRMSDIIQQAYAHWHDHCQSTMDAVIRQFQSWYTVCSRERNEMEHDNTIADFQKCLDDIRKLEKINKEENRYRSQQQTRKHEVSASELGYRRVLADVRGPPQDSNIQLIDDRSQIRKDRLIQSESDSSSMMMSRPDLEISRQEYSASNQNYYQEINHDNSNRIYTGDDSACVTTFNNPNINKEGKEFDFVELGKKNTGFSRDMIVPKLLPGSSTIPMSQGIPQVSLSSSSLSSSSSRDWEKSVQPGLHTTLQFSSADTRIPIEFQEKYVPNRFPANVYHRQYEKEGIVPIPIHEQMGESFSTAHEAGDDVAARSGVPTIGTLAGGNYEDIVCYVARSGDADDDSSQSEPREELVARNASGSVMDSIVGSISGGTERTGEDNRTADENLAAEDLMSDLAGLGIDLRHVKKLQYSSPDDRPN